VPLGVYELDRRFRHHPPDDATAERRASSRAAVRSLPGELDALLPDGPVIIWMIDSARTDVKRPPRIRSHTVGLLWPR
jgi:hypothetical protein